MDKHKFITELRKLDASSLAKLWVKASGLIPEVVLSDETADLLVLYDGSSEDEKLFMQRVMERELGRAKMLKDRRERNPGGRGGGPG